MKPTKSRSGVSFDPETLEKAKVVADDRYKGNVSALIDEALRAYMAGSILIPDSKDPQCLVKLCEQFVSFLAPTMRRTCESRDQPRILGAFLANFALGKIDISEDFLAMLEDFRTQNPSKK